MVTSSPLKYRWLNKKTRKYLKNGYLTDGQTAEERIQIICDTAEKLLNKPGYSDKLNLYIANGWIGLSSPIWSNFGNKRGYPISCFSSYFDDTILELLTKTAETGVMTKVGGGTSGYFGAVRPRGSPISTGGTTNGAVHFMQLVETTTNVISQSNVRRGSFAAYLPIDHPDFEEFLNIQEIGNPIQHLHMGACISDKFMIDMLEGNERNRELWAKMVQKRSGSGEPYLFFTDNANNQAPQVYKDKGLKINNSNLCNEIFLSNSPNESFVCDLSSVNLLYYDEWKDTDLIETVVYLLDAVMTEFITKTENEPFMQDARRFAINQRAIGVGVIGYHSLLQSKMIPFESFEAKMLNVSIFKNIREQCDLATQKAALDYGEPPLLEGYGRRNSTTMALAPTTSNAHILGQVSQAIEPYNSNYYTKGLAKGDETFKNPYLKELLKQHDKDEDDIWENVLVHGGSVQQLSFLSDLEKDVFKTFGEISQKEIVIQAAQRQKYIDQGQSLNLMIPATADQKEISDLLIFGWDMGLKGFYYQRSSNSAQTLARSIMTCKSCES
jgi:ribonucleoside-diphosphate reductase alpha chain